eukprot:scaffold62861_cov60-Phaeocystis_antarctica.AAC.2
MFDGGTRVGAIAVPGVDVDWALSAPFTANGIARRRPALALDGAVRDPPRCLRVEPPVRVRGYFQIGLALVEPSGGRKRSNRPADACTGGCGAKERAKWDAAGNRPPRLLGCEQRFVEHCGGERDRQRNAPKPGTTLRLADNTLKRDNWTFTAYSQPSHAALPTTSARSPWQHRRTPRQARRRRPSMCDSPLPPHHRHAIARRLLLSHAADLRAVAGRTRGDPGRWRVECSPRRSSRLGCRQRLDYQVPAPACHQREQAKALQVSQHPREKGQRPAFLREHGPHRSTRSRSRPSIRCRRSLSVLSARGSARGSG